MNGDPRSAVDPTTLVGVHLAELCSSWHVFDGVRDEEPMHVWLRWREAGWCQLQPGSGDLGISWENPYASYDVGEYGRVVDQPGGQAVLAGAVGTRLTRTGPLWMEPPGYFCGHLFDFGGSLIATANLGDELAFIGRPTGRG